MSERNVVPWWAVASAITAPVAMIGGWTLAAAQQPSFDATTETISALATAPMATPWIMGAGLALTGVAHVVTAAGLRPLPCVARVVHAVGGVATLAVAALPVDAYPHPHGIAAAVGFGALALWPALSARRRAGARERALLPPPQDRAGPLTASPGPVVARPVAAVGATVVLAGLLAVFVLELEHLTPSDGRLTGLWERAVAGGQALWPLVVVVAWRRWQRRAGGAIRP